MELLSYIASIIAIIFGICAPFFKKIKYVLACNFMVNVMTGASYLLVGSLSGCAIALVGGFQLFINHIFTEKKGKIPLCIIILHILTFVVADVLMFRAWYDILILSASVIFVISISQTNTKFFRILYFFNNSLMILYDIFSESYGNLMMHGVLLLASVFAILIRDIKKKKNEI